MQRGRHFKEPWPSCGGTIHFSSTFCKIHAWVVSVSLYPNPYAHHMAGWVGRWANVQAVVERKVSAAAGCQLLPLRYSSRHSILCELHSRHKLYWGKTKYIQICCFYSWQSLKQSPFATYNIYISFILHPLRTDIFPIKSGIDKSEFH
jgi:hypothetical protein